MISYYGGNCEVMERTTRVKARVKAHALKELLESKEKVVIMAHKIPDPDAIGAAVVCTDLDFLWEERHISL